MPKEGIGTNKKGKKEKMLVLEKKRGKKRTMEKRAMEKRAMEKRAMETTVQETKPCKKRSWKRKWLTRMVVALLAVLCLGLAGCSGYSSSFTATILISSNTPDSSSVEFSTLKGTKVLQMKTKKDGAKLEYSGKLDKGSITVYYDEDGTKKELFSISEGEAVEENVTISQKGRVYVIIETDGKCEGGKFTFKIK